MSDLPPINPNPMTHGWHFIQLPDWLLRFDGVSAGAKLFYARLARFCEGVGPFCWRETEMAAWFGMAGDNGSRQVRRWVRELEAAGLLRTTRTRPAGYQFLHHPAMETPAQPDKTSASNRTNRPPQPDRVSASNRTVRPPLPHVRHEKTRGDSPAAPDASDPEEAIQRAALDLVRRHEAAWFEYWHRPLLPREHEALAAAFALYLRRGVEVTPAQIQQAVAGAVAWCDANRRGLRTVGVLTEELSRVLFPRDTPEHRERRLLEAANASHTRRVQEDAAVHASRRSQLAATPGAGPLWASLWGAADPTARGMLDLTAAVRLHSGALVVTLETSSAAELLRRRREPLLARVREQVPTFPPVRFVAEAADAP